MTESCTIGLFVQKWVTLFANSFIKTAGICLYECYHPNILVLLIFRLHPFHKSKKMPSYEGEMKEHKKRIEGGKEIESKRDNSRHYPTFGNFSGDSNFLDWTY